MRKGIQKAVSFVASVLLGGAVTVCGAEQSLQEAIVTQGKITEELQSKYDLSKEGIPSGETMVFDFTTDDEAKNLLLDIWSCQEGSWVCVGGVEKPVKVGSTGQIIIERAEGYHMIIADTEGNMQYRTEELMDFSNQNIVGGPRLFKPTRIELEKEIPLMVTYGTPKDCLEVSTSEDFRAVECETGIAFVVTFSKTEE